MDERVEAILRRQADLEAERGNWENLWQQIGDRILTRHADFHTFRTPGEDRTTLQYDATAALALDRFAAAMESMLTPRAQKWHRLKCSDEELDQHPQVRRYLDQVNNILFAARYSPRANFASQTHETYMGLGAFGTGVLWIDELPGESLRYRAIHLGEAFISEDHHGRIDSLHRKFELTARQALQKKEWRETLPEAIRETVKKQPERKFEFIHCVKPNEERDYGKLDYSGMPWASYYIACEGRQLLQEGGFKRFPYAVSRYVTAPREKYGRSPAMTVLPDIKMLNEMNKTVIRAAQKVVDPPLLLHEDGAMQPFSFRPGALNYGTMGSDGRALVVPLQTGARVDIGLDMLEQKRRLINDAFLVTLFQILIETPAMTATEAMLRAQEKGALLAPTMGRQQSELLGPIIERELQILEDAGQLPPMPAVMEEAGIGFRIEYEGPMVRLQKAEGAIGIMRTIEALAPLAEIDPRALRRINADAALAIIAEANGVPAKALYSDEELAAMDEQQAQQQAASTLLQAVPAASQAALNLAKAQSVGAAAPPQIAPALFPA